jgi:hypothetical protein
MLTYNDIWHLHVGLCSNGDDQVYRKACPTCIAHTRQNEETNGQVVQDNYKDR